jgi:hypothetical protein
MRGVKADRRETPSRSQDAPPPLERGERRSPALVVQVRDVGVLIALLTAIDTTAKVLLCG